MDEASARAAIGVPRETIERLDAFVELLREENERQNLVSRATLDQVWNRHILDSAQLLKFARPGSGSWLDLGTGAGFPGLILSLLSPCHFTLVESRRLRVDFLTRAADLLGVRDMVDVICMNIEKFDPQLPFDTISARAFAPLDRLLTLGERFATPNTRWVLPKGKNAQSELEAAESSWQGSFRLEPSVTDPEARIIVAEGVRRRAKGKRAR